MERSLFYSGQISTDGQNFRFAESVNTYAKRDQMIVWISVVARRHFDGVDHRKRVERFADLQEAGLAIACPAIIDTGCSAAFVVHEWHLDNIFRIPVRDQEVLSRKGTTLMGRRCSVLGLDLWFHKDGQIADPANAVRLANAANVVKTKIDALNDTKETAEQQRGRWFSGRSKQPNSDVMVLPEKRMDDIKANIFPRLPLFTVRLLRSNKLELVVDPVNDKFALYKIPSPNAKQAVRFEI